MERSQISTRAPLSSHTKNEGAIEQPGNANDSAAAQGREIHEVVHPSDEAALDSLDDTPLQMQSSSALQGQELHSAMGDEGVRSRAAAGVAGQAQKMPHLAPIQRAFGRHDVRDTKAHVGGTAGSASRAIGAQAYAMGDHVAFERAPTLHTAAHEAAHVVQQRAGARPAGGVGRVGDRFEGQADKVADRVVEGRSAEPLLDGVAVGHDGGSSTEQAARSSSVQMLVNAASTLDDIAHADTVQALVTDYNADAEEMDLLARITALKGVRMGCIAWINRHDVDDLTTVDGFDAVKNLLNSVQTEHVSLMALSEDREDDDTDPPIANFGDLDETTQGTVRTLWAAIISGEDGITIQGTETGRRPGSGGYEAIQREHEGFREKVLSSFSRLLETEFGRKLVTAIVTETKGGKQLTIKGVSSRQEGNYPASPFEAHSPKDEDDQTRLKALDVAPTENQDAYVRVATGLSHPEKLARIQEIRMISPRPPGFVIEHEGADKYFQFNEGMDEAWVDFSQNLTDWTQYRDSRMLDEDGREIIYPTFAIFGHELGHILNTFRGAITDQPDLSRKLIETTGGTAEDLQHWSNKMEEYHNIKTVENKVREEQGLKARHGHGNVIQKVTDAINQQCEAFYTEHSEHPQFRAQIEPFVLAAFDAAARSNFDTARQQLRLATVRIQELQQEELQAVVATPRRLGLFGLIKKHIFKMDVD